MECAALLICPVCSDALAAAEGSVKCGAGHAFNRARDGYIDLLPAGHGRTRAQGDTREMIEARRRILERGLFAGVEEALGAAVLRHVQNDIPPERPVTLLEAGCGVGHYLRKAAQAVRARSSAAIVTTLGFDISRAALRVAARADRTGCYFVNDVRHAISVASGSVDILLDVFAPRNPGEFARVLRPDGVVVVVVPVTGHLAELRRHVPLLRIDADKHERVARLMQPHFTMTDHRSVRAGVRADPADVLDLVLMSPSRWHTDPDALRRQLPDAQVEATIAVDVLEFHTAIPGTGS